MSSIRLKVLLIAFGLAACSLSSCGPAALKESLEVASVSYDTSGTPHCAGQVRNNSPQVINDLQVQVEFQNADGNRVRTGTESVSPNNLAPGISGSFSVPYQKGSNDPPVVRCRVVEFKSSDGGLVPHSDKSVSSPGP
jgi:hypothetical protein